MYKTVLKQNVSQYILVSSITFKLFSKIRPEKKSSDSKKYAPQAVGDAVHRVRWRGGGNCDSDSWSAAITVCTTEEAGVQVAEKSGVVSSHCFPRYETEQIII